MIEQWKSINGYEGLYEVSNFGRVKSLAKQWSLGNGRIFRRKEKILKPRLDGSRYLFITLCKERIQTNKKNHILCWESFGSFKRNGRILQVDHIDNNKQNNNIDNLQLLTNRQNCSKGRLQYKKTSKFTGVSFHKRLKKWDARIQINGKQKYLGLFENEYQAHLVYQHELKHIIKGEL